MMAWLWSQCPPLTLLLGLLLMARPLLLKYAGARCQYSLWLAVPLALLCSALP
jgi:bla regulator protein BlaR1